MYDELHRIMLAGDPGRLIPQWTMDTLRSIADGRNPLAAVRHPLGFICLPVERTGERGICVHVWSERLTNAGPTTSTTHAHSWDLFSYVLYGTLCNKLVTVTDAPDTPTHRVYEIGSGPDGDEIRRTGRLVSQHGPTSDFHRRGAVYQLPAGVFHDTEASGETATVALGSGRPGSVDLALGAVHTESHRIRRQLCDRDETAFAATLAAEQLAGTPAPRP